VIEPHRSDQHRSRLRVALIGCTGLLGDIITKAVDDEPSIDVVSQIDASALANPPAQHIDADLILWHNADEDEVSRWLRAGHTVPRVLATVGDGRSASLWELKPHRTELGAVSPGVLIDTIRATISQPIPNPTAQERSWPKN
jgi:hypothetical protein